MMRLTLMRHAQADAASAAQTDFDRTLTRRGSEEAAEMARRFKLRGARIDTILASAAPRAFATAEIVARALNVPASALVREPRLYSATADEYLSLLQDCDSTATHVLVVAHNPSISDCAERLSAEGHIDPLPPAGAVTLHFDLTNWCDLTWNAGTVVEFDQPGRAL